MSIARRENAPRARQARPAGHYGIDAPWVPWLWLAIGVVYLVIGVLAPTSWGAPAWVGIGVGVLGIVFLAGAGCYWYATLRGKFEVWHAVFAGLSDPRPGRYEVLDLGCGRGAVAIAAALRFPTARVTGVDLWRSIDQSGNDPEATLANARANGVDARIELVTHDMTELPLPDGGFDLVTASMAIHNVPSPAGREAAIREAWRVLAPGGRLVIVDIQRTREYAHTLGSLGATPTLSDAGPRMWWSGPWLATRVLEANKPE